MTLDLRTKAGREQELINQIEECGGFSVFWITVVPQRAFALMRLENAGIVKTKTERYPHYSATYDAEKAAARGLDVYGMDEVE